MRRGGPGRRAAWAALLLAVLPAAGAHAGFGAFREQAEEGVQIQVDDRWVDSLRTGVYPVRVRAMLAGPEEEADSVWTLEWRSGRADGTTQVRRLLRRGAPQTFVLHVPIGASDRVGILALHADLPGRPRQTIFLNDHTQSARYSGAPHLVQDAPRVLAVSERGVTVPPQPSEDPTSPLWAAHIPPLALPGDWTSYLGLDAVLIPWDERGRIPPAARAALRDWAAAGGAVLFAGVPADWVPQALEALDVPPEIRAAAHPVTAARLPWVRGVILGSPVGISPLLAPAMAPSLPRAADGLTRAEEDYSHGWYYDHGSIDMSVSLPIPGVGAAPVGGLLAGAILFTILIGPVNYFLLRRRMRTYLFWVTTPAGSALATLLLLGYGYASEGFGIRGRQIAHRIVDAPARTEVTLTHQTLYAGIAPGEGLSFDARTAVQRLGTNEVSLATDETEGLNLASGWLGARTQTEFLVLRAGPTRARVAVVRDGGGWAVENGLGEPLERIRVWLPDGSWGEAGPVPDGARVPLSPATRATGVIDPLTTDVQEIVGRMAERSRPGAPGDFEALARSPMAPWGIEGVASEESVSIVSGRAIVLGAD